MATQTVLDIKSLLDKIEPLIRTMHYGKVDIGLSPAGEHVVTSIKYQGLLQMRKEFIQRLTSSIVRYVLSKSKYAAGKEQLLQAGFDQSDAEAEIFQRFYTAL